MLTADYDLKASDLQQISNADALAGMFVALGYDVTAHLTQTPDARQHFWRYYDLSTKKITDNCFTIASLIACSPDTPRFLGEADVFAIQEKVKQSILESIQTQVAMEAAPKITHPIQQTVSTVLRETPEQPETPARSGAPGTARS